MSEQNEVKYCISYYGIQNDQTNSADRHPVKICQSKNAKIVKTTNCKVGSKKEKPNKNSSFKCYSKQNCDDFTLKNPYGYYKSLDFSTKMKTIYATRHIISVHS